MQLCVTHIFANFKVRQCAVDLDLEVLKKENSECTKSIFDSTPGTLIINAWSCSLAHSECSCKMQIFFLTKNYVTMVRNKIRCVLYLNEGKQGHTRIERFVFNERSNLIKSNMSQKLTLINYFFKNHLRASINQNLWLRRH